MSAEYHSSVRRDIVPLVPRAERLLDVGGGTGATAKFLKREGYAREIGVMDAVAPSDDREIDFHSRADLNDPSAIDSFFEEAGPFDTILLLDVLEHLVDPWTIVKSFAKHVPEDGVMVASIPNVRHHSVTANLLFRNRWTYTDSGLLDRTHLRFFVRETAIDLMTLPGFRIEEVANSPISGRSKQFLNAATFGALRSFLTLQYFIRIRKVSA
ncbi:class I SAM-dependent methyltransferase [Erythrobacter sp. THAF29]|uniref:class I SAM-dependent methyltransferase n=1 Tax=Erythrobacter sp. THAF29 TaxID=2587851 RepID=UPI0012A8BAF6|nr:class I SAM-dependent methyltransferase [Erythrobacter sp. THAF29]QFT75976.1 bifunctional 3-demethylubiquinone-9 3-methyltransferase/ 2-octaprenyl-6-hydroxy phenol methylase [Erythrobacter sp. THAF29]